MNEHADALDLLIARSQGGEIRSPNDVETLCRERPDLAEELRRLASSLDAMKWLEDEDSLADDATIDADARSPTSRKVRSTGLSLQQFRERVLDASLVSEADLDAVVAASAAHPIGSAIRLAEGLVQRDRLTRYQADALLADDGSPLVLGNYVILGVIGQGGMGRVYEARHRRMDRRVALKTFPDRNAADAEAVRRFQREVRAAARLNHPNVVTAYDADEAGGTPFLVMELVEGVDLFAKVTRDGPLGVDEAVSCVLQAARGLAYAHEQGVIHRDVKPGNLLLDRQGRVRILDLGLARIAKGLGDVESHSNVTRTGATVGTVHYMAPEQADPSRTVDPRCDVYGLGCTLFYLLDGRPPFQGQSLLSRLTYGVDAPMPDLSATNPAVSAELACVCARALALRPEDRYPDMPSFAAALEGGQSATDTNVAATSSGKPAPEATRDRHGDRDLSAVGPKRSRDRFLRPLATGVSIAVGVAAIVGLALAYGIELFDFRQLSPDDANEVAEASSGGASASRANDRALATWALAKGAILEVYVDDRFLEPRSAGDLPDRGVVRLVAVEFQESADVRDEDLGRFVGLRDLARLGLYGVPISDSAGPTLAKLVHLEKLGLGKTRISDEILVSVAQLPKLSILRLNETGLSDVGLGHLARLDSLQEVDLQGTAVTPEGVARLQEALPSCRIVADWSR